MRKLFLIILLFAIRPVSYSISEEKTIIHTSTDVDPYQLYTEMQLEKMINYVAFQQAVLGYNKIQEKKKRRYYANRFHQTLLGRTVLCS